jgi:hypothetical protein
MVKVWTGFSWLMAKFKSRPYENCNKNSGYIRRGIWPLEGLEAFHQGLCYKEKATAKQNSVHTFNSYYNQRQIFFKSLLNVYLITQLLSDVLISVKIGVLKQKTVVTVKGKFCLCKIKNQPTKAYVPMEVWPQEFAREWMVSFTPRPLDSWVSARSANWKEREMAPRECQG